MNYKETLDYLFSQLPMYQRIGHAAYKSDLSTTILLDEHFKHPHKSFKSIHIAGTNGKGSVAHFISSVLQEAGYKTGLYTSPHLKDFRERIRINGQMVSEEYVVDFVKDNKKIFEETKPSFFEMTVALAFQYFKDEEVDFAVVETGMGGRLDSTNIISPILSVITNIGFDHTRFLGDTLDKIASEKAEIIKENTAVIIGQTQSETKEIFENKAFTVNAPIMFADQEIELKSISNAQSSEVIFDVWKNSELYIDQLECPLAGEYQKMNLVTAIKVFDYLADKYGISKKIIVEGVGQTISSTGFKGRWQILSNNPLTICDTAHNKDGLKVVVDQLSRMRYEHLHFVLGTVNDKNIHDILTLLPRSARYYFCKADIPRALDEEELSQAAHKAGLNGSTYSSVREAYNSAINNAGSNDLVFIGGSTFVVAEIV